MQSLIAYTIGRTTGYDADLAANPNLRKIGRGGDYGGGWVFQTAEEAARFIGSATWRRTTLFDPADFSVYVLELPGSWEDCASPEPDPSDGVHRLLRDARILRKAVLR